jgi:hypothetical protein
MENQKLTEEELQKIGELQQKNNAVVAELGQIELIKMNVHARREAAEKYLAELREEEDTLGKELSDKYGSGSINLETGEFVPAPEEAAEEVAE